jgi:hypothetical protein
MSTPPLSARDLRAAAGAHRELGAEYSDAVLDSFLEKLEDRLEERLSQSIPDRKLAPISERAHVMLSGMAIGGGAVGILLSILGYDHTIYYLPGVKHIWLAILVASIISCVAGLTDAYHHRG